MAPKIMSTVVVKSVLVVILIQFISPCRLVKTIDSGAFDFIIVGAGSAGSVIANRLSANGTFDVLLLEQGPEPSVLSRIPAFCPLMYYTRNAHKECIVEPQPDMAQGLVGRVMPPLKGKGLGGSSLINYMLHIRGHRIDWDRLAEDGNPGWSYEEVLPYFKKSEDAHISHFDPKYRSKGGVLGVEERPVRTKIGEQFLKGCNESGLNILQDYNDGNQFGVGYVQTTQRNGERCDTYTAFLKDVMNKRKNLSVLMNAIVTKLLMVRKAVTGVEFKMGKLMFRARATREVILSAGPYQSPQILMLSGIGPKKELERLGVKLVKNLPVGGVLNDHVSFPALLFKLNQTGLEPHLTDILNPKNMSEILNGHLGVLSSPGNIEAFAFVKTKESKETVDLPDVELVFATGSFNSLFGLLTVADWAIKNKIVKKIWGPLMGTPVWQIFPLIYHPKSRGHLTLRSKNPEDPPVLHYNLFTDPENHDLKTFIAAIRVVQRIAKSPALAKYGSEMVLLPPVPGCESSEIDSDEYWGCQIKYFISNLYQETSTCKMGPKNDPEAVVDSKLRVYGIKNLRVADSSIFPCPMSFHSNIPTIMVGEKASEMILESHMDHK